MTEIRALKNKDLFRVSGMLVNAVANGTKEIQRIFSSGREQAADAVESKRQLEEQGIRIAALVLQVCYTNSVEELQAWFADLLNMTAEEYLDGPITLTMDIIESLTRSEESRDFFSRALRLSRATNKSVDSFLAGLGL